MKTYITLLICLILVSCEGGGGAAATGESLTGTESNGVAIGDYFTLSNAELLYIGSTPNGVMEARSNCDGSGYLQELEIHEDGEVIVREIHDNDNDCSSPNVGALMIIESSFSYSYDSDTSTFTLTHNQTDYFAQGVQANLNYCGGYTTPNGAWDYNVADSNCWLLADGSQFQLSPVLGDTTKFIYNNIEFKSKNH